MKTNEKRMQELGKIMDEIYDNNGSKAEFDEAFSEWMTLARIEYGDEFMDTRIASFREAFYASAENELNIVF